LTVPRREEAAEEEGQKRFVFLSIARIPVAIRPVEMWLMTSVSHLTANGKNMTWLNRMLGFGSRIVFTRNWGAQFELVQCMPCDSISASYVLRI